MLNIGSRQVILNKGLSEHHSAPFGVFSVGAVLKSARMGGRDVLQTGLDISRAQAVGRLEVELTLTGGRVDGTVLQDQKPVPGVLVVLVPDTPFRNREEMYSMKNTDQLGRYSLLGLPPGEDSDSEFREPVRSNVDGELEE